MIAKLKGGEASSSIQNSFTSLASVHHVNAVVGISVEPLAVLGNNISLFVDFLLSFKLMRLTL